MPDTVEIELPTEKERQQLILGVSGIVGGSVLGYFALQSIKGGDLFGVEQRKARPDTGFESVGNLVFGTIGVILFGMAVNDTAKEYGWKSIGIGAGAITAIGLVSWLVKR